MTPETREHQKRRKIALACEPCRERKARCDGRKPICSTCERRSLGLEQCIYKAGNVRSACSEDYTRALHERIRKLEQACALHGVDVSSLDTPAAAAVQAPPGQGSGMPAPVQVRSPSTADASNRPSESHPITPASLLGREDSAEKTTGLTAMGTVLSEEDLDTSRPETDDFYGRSSAASFLKEAASSMRRRLVGSSSRPFHVSATPPKQRVLLSSSHVGKFVLPPRALADHLLERYWERVYYLYPFFDRTAFESAYKTLWEPRNDRTDGIVPFRGLGLGCVEADASTIVFHCALNCIFALGCCFSDLPPGEKPGVIETFFDRAKSFIGLDFLDENNLGVVQALLIIALVLQGTPFPNRCWNSVGVACRVAQGLGLHTEVGWRSRNDREKEIRRRTWHGCVVMDILVSMTFGRPTMTSSLSITADSLNSYDVASLEPCSKKVRMLFYKDSIRLSLILEGILQKIYQPWLHRDTNTDGHSSASFNNHYSLDTVIELQAQLTAFEQSISPPLSWVSPLRLDYMSAEDRRIMEMQKNVLQARFFYMQLILHRPILTQLAAAESSTHQESAGSDLARRSFSSIGLRFSFALQSAKACVEASKRLIQLIHSVHQTDKTDAWWWNGLYASTAGIVLIVARLCPSLWETLDESEIATLWEHCKSILHHQATFSVLARESLKLLILVNDHVMSKQADATEDTNARPPSHTSPQSYGEVLVGAQDELLSNIQTMFPLQDSGLNLESTYMMPFFTWDPALGAISANLDEQFDQGP
ncbi:hypothetical protein VTK73DRAFT_4209 [Phialemonium thermophilum]|uniref:Zn(2)-C6 fungal-type domain-containing protein n=1 Tax=Phialemonium thermophilum TaxID=223376 RepID=A0ABR3WUM3_9PEZI